MGDYHVKVNKRDLEEIDFFQVSFCCNQILLCFRKMFMVASCGKAFALKPS